MRIAFDKIHGAGNDFIVVNDLAQQLNLTVEQVRLLCDRHFGIGADGVILARPAAEPDAAAFMHYINADGSLAEMCGNGVRCFAKYLLDHHLTPGTAAAPASQDQDSQARGDASHNCAHCAAGTQTQTSMTIATPAGLRQVSYTFLRSSSAKTPALGVYGDSQEDIETPRVSVETPILWASVDMGAPRFAPESIPTSLSATRELPASTGSGSRENAVVLARVTVPKQMLKAVFARAGAKNPARERALPLTVASDVHNRERSPREHTLPLTCVNMGNPHAVLFWQDVDEQLARSFAADPSDFDITEPGSFLEALVDVFPKKTNVEFAAVVGPNRLAMRVFERGVGETLACGTGACATALAAIILGRAKRSQPVWLQLPGGLLCVRWRDDGHVLLSGPAQTVFRGSIDLDDLTSCPEPAALDNLVSRHESTALDDNLSLPRFHNLSRSSHEQTIRRQ
ncbi:MAG: diaminopimelate epimerase [Coriobacteriales bacterium]|jgi:diaminopimelate epimerase|nr:diaminopimelate epimerase [Coriobacteriales bacterium]